MSWRRWWPCQRCSWDWTGQCSHGTGPMQAFFTRSASTGRKYPLLAGTSRGVRAHTPTPHSPLPAGSRACPPVCSCFPFASPCRYIFLPCPRQTFMIGIVTHRVLQAGPRGRWLCNQYHPRHISWRKTSSQSPSPASDSHHAPCFLSLPFAPCPAYYPSLIDVVQSSATH